MSCWRNLPVALVKTLNFVHDKVPNEHVVSQVATVLFLVEGKHL